MDNNKRTWESGAWRDTNTDKLDYEAFYNPLVVREFARYMHKHRKQSDGKLRSGDNWQGLFGTPEEHRKVCMKSLWRHFHDLWMFHRGYVGRDTIKEALCAILFNVQAYLFSILIEEEEDMSHPSDLPPIGQEKYNSLFDCKVEEKPDGVRIFSINDKFLGEVDVYSSPCDMRPGYRCESNNSNGSECDSYANRRLMYLYEGTKVQTWRCDKHETMPI